MRFLGVGCKHCELDRFGILPIKKVEGLGVDPASEVERPGPQAVAEGERFGTCSPSKLEAQTVGKV